MGKGKEGPGKEGGEGREGFRKWAGHNGRGLKISLFASTKLPHLACV